MRQQTKVILLGVWTLALISWAGALSYWWVIGHKPQRETFYIHTLPQVGHIICREGGRIDVYNIEFIGINEHEFKRALWAQCLQKFP
jgi:hypothetical protein